MEYLVCVFVVIASGILVKNNILWNNLNIVGKVIICVIPIIAFVVTFVWFAIEVISDVVLMVL